VKDRTKDPTVPTYIDGTSAYQDKTCESCGQKAIPVHVFKWDSENGRRATKKVRWSAPRCIDCDRKRTNFMQKQRADLRKQALAAEGVVANQVKIFC
jgi:hypothetical protein